MLETDIDRFAKAVDRAVEGPAFAAEEWWVWASEDETSFYREMEACGLAEFTTELDRLASKALEVVHSIKDVAKLFPSRG